MTHNNEGKENCCNKCSKSKEVDSYINPFGRTICYCGNTKCDCHTPTEEPKENRLIIQKMGETSKSTVSKVFNEPKDTEEGWEKEIIDGIVTRFLGWKLPADFNPDGGISFKQTINEDTEYPSKNEPIGTNLLTATQAREMVEYILGDALSENTRKVRESTITSLCVIAGGKEPENRVFHEIIKEYKEKFSLTDSTE